MIQTPYYLIDKQKLLGNLEKIAYVREQSGAKALLALKCFATWSVFDLMQHFVLAVRTQARPAEVRRRNPRLQRGLGR